MRTEVETHREQKQNLSMWRIVTMGGMKGGVDLRWTDFKPKN